MLIQKTIWQVAEGTGHRSLIRFRCIPAALVDCFGRGQVPTNGHGTSVINNICRGILVQITMQNKPDKSCLAQQPPLFIQTRPTRWSIEDDSAFTSFPARRSRRVTTNPPCALYVIFFHHSLHWFVPCKTSDAPRDIPHVHKSQTDLSTCFLLLPRAPGVLTVHIRHCCHVL